MKFWSVYVLRCADGTLYTGIAKDAEKRLIQHNSGKGAAYTRSRRPARLLYLESARNRSKALIREAQIKALNKSQKEALVKAAAIAKSIPRKSLFAPSAPPPGPLRNLRFRTSSRELRRRSEKAPVSVPLPSTGDPPATCPGGACRSRAFGVGRGETRAVALANRVPDRTSRRRVS